jgi:hypothetical protein
MAIGCFLAACIIAQVDGYAGPAVDPHLVYQVAPGSKEQMGDLQWQEFNGELRNALIVSGFNVPPTIQTEPEVMVLLTYLVEPRNRSVTQVLGGSRGTTTIAPTYAGAPQLGYTATTEGASAPVAVTQQVTTYFRAIDVTAYDYKVFKATKQLQQVWKVTVTSEGTSGDMRSVLPVLLAEGRPYFGKSTGRKIDVKMSPESREVEMVRTGGASGRPTR